MDIERGGDDLDRVIDEMRAELEKDLRQIENRDKKRKLKVKFKGKNDDPPPGRDSGDGGVREPIRPGPITNLGGAALALPESE